MERKKIDFSELLFDIRKNLKLYSIVVALAFIVGLLFSFSIPKEYEANVILAPESSGEDMGGNISSLASMVGVNLGVGGYSDAYYPEIYPEIFHSNDFIIPLWSIGVENLKGNIKTTLYEYMLKHQKTAWWNYPRSWINIIIRSFSSDNNDSKLESKSIDTFHLTEEQNNVTNAIKGMVNCNVDQKTNLITISVHAQDPQISAIVADSAQKALQRFITNYRTKKARNDLNHINELYIKAKADYEKARRTYGTYADRNNDLLLESYKAKQEDLENDMQLKYNIYTQLVQQKQLASAKLIEQTPVFTVVQSATVPLKKSKPKRMIITLAFVFLAFCGTTLFIENKKQKVE